jgi:hypothetical protein
MKIIRETPLQLALESKALFGLLGTTTYLFDKTAGTLTIASKGILGNKKQEHALAEIKDAVVQESVRGAEERNDPTARTYRIKLVKQDGSGVPLTTLFTSGKKSKEQLADAIRQFLHSGSGASTPPLPT